MNPPLTPPRRGTDRTRTDACSPPGRGRGWVGSWKASFRSCACIGTMNPPLAPPRRGTDRTRTDACSPPGRGWGWIGSWKGPGSRRRRDLLRNEGNYPPNFRATHWIVLPEETHSHFPPRVLPGEVNFVRNRLAVRL